MAKKVVKSQKDRLFEDVIVPAEAGSGKLFEVDYQYNNLQPVQCLGMTFPDESARRDYFTERLRDRLSNPEFRRIEGFPVGEDEDIIALSDPPYYTACPNPFIADFIEFHGRNRSDSHSQPEPFASDITEGKTDPIYNAHSYHTKVPPNAIAKYIAHYTKPGDIVLDAFSGSGMTGVATARLDGRYAILVDLAPAATFIASNYCTPVDIIKLEQAAALILDEIESELGWMYSTVHDSKQSSKGVIDYVIWSDCLICNECNKEFSFWDAAVNWKEGEKGSVASSFDCPNCSANVSKRGLERAFNTVRDDLLGKTIKRRKMLPVRISYKFGRKRFEKNPDSEDAALLDRITETPIFDKVPTDMMMGKEGSWGDLWRGYHESFTHAHHFYFRRNLAVLARFCSKAQRSPYRNQLLAALTGVLKFAGFQNRISPSSTMGLFRTMSGTLYLGSIVGEVNLIESLRGRLSKKKLKPFYPTQRRATFISTNSSTSLAGIPDASIDYVFVDPPFGDNLPYSELNFLWEVWLGVKTNNSKEAIVSSCQKKSVIDYGRLMTACFREIYRVMKPGRWMTVEFHNSRNSVWAAIQESILQAGLVVADVRILDKGNVLTKKQVTGPNAVNKDLVISAYKPEVDFEQQFSLEAGTEKGVWEFVRNHLKHLPVFVQKGNRGEPIVERQTHLLFDRMIALHVQRGYSVPLSAAEFYSGLRQRFPERDGMYFLPDQVNEYDQKRLQVDKVDQLELFVNDEKTAIQWVRQQLNAKPTTYQDLQPVYMKEAQQAWEKHEQPLELREILEQNFVEEQDGKWRVPNPKKESDLEQMRHRTLIKEFQHYFDAKGKIKIVRSEALRAGFKEAWQKKEYATILQIAKRVPDSVIQEDPALLMYYDNASLLLGD